MKITVVTFMAFSMVHTLVFVKGETFEQIHERLSIICETYDPLSILQSDDAEQVSLNQLNNLKPETNV